MILSAVRDQIAVSWDGADLLTVLPESQRPTVEELRDGDFVHNLREAGFTVMVDQRVVEALLIEHPGHGDQKVHGRRGSSAPSTGGVEMMPRISARFSGQHPAAGGGGNNATLEVLANMSDSPGDLDTMGKVLEANGYLTDKPAARAAAADKISDEIRNLDYERANLVFPNGEVYRGAEGTVDTSFIPAGLQRFASIDIHNHPSGSAHSPQDINPFDSRVPKDEIRIATAAGDHSLRPGPAGWGDRETYQYTSDRAYDRITSNFGTLLSETPLDTSLRFWDDVAPRMGWSLSSPSRPSDTNSYGLDYPDLEGPDINTWQPSFGGELP